MRSTSYLLRKTLGLALVAATAMVPGIVSAQNTATDTQTIRLIVPFSPGSQTDIVARLVSKPLSEKLGQSIVVENRPGAASWGGAHGGRAAPADGNTLMLVSSAWSVLPVTGRTLSFDPQKDFDVLGMVARSPNVLVVSKSLNAKSFADFVKYAKENPESMNFGSSGVASGTHLNAEYFLSMTDLQAMHVPMRGGPETLTELIGGRLQFAFLPPSGVVSGDTSRFDMLGITGKQRVKALPDVPTLIESGVENFEYYLWYALLAKHGTDAKVTQRLSSALQEVLQDPEVVATLDGQYIEAVSLSQDESAAYILGEVEKNATLVKERNLQLSN